MKLGFGLPAELAEIAEEYEFVSELGRGGSAIVYRARDRALGRDVAIKVVHPRPTSPNDDPVARLAREARTVAQLHHPGIVSVYAVRRMRSGGLALVMQLVPGATLKALVQREGPLEAHRAEDIIRDVARALAYAHAHRVIHRDVKPENIFLDADTGRALLADFGIARSGDTESHTLTGTAIGTPFYMSPEQIDGLAVDGRSDVYSLGLVAWEMLTGVRPWDGESLYHVIYKQKNEELAPIEAMRRDVPRRLQYIVERMLQKRPAARWAGADGLLVQLERTILPADFARWQAALPGRVARARAVAAVQRPPVSKPPSVVDFAAATMRFVPSGPDLAAAESPAQPIPAAELTAPASPRGDERTTAQVGEPAVDVVPLAAVPEATSSLDDGSPAYDTVDPTWAPVDPVKAYPSRTPAARRLVTIGLAGGVVITSIAAFSAKDRPSRMLPPPSAMLATLGTQLGPSAPERVGAQPTRGGPRGVGGVPADTVGAGSGLVAVGARHACSVMLAGTAQCWGANTEGQLGTGATTPSVRSLPQPVAGVMTYVKLTAGTSHTCGLTSSGDVYCWGSNTRGQLGDGTLVARSAPVRIGGQATYQEVRAGASHTCGLDVVGAVFCWGDDSEGQLGDGSNSPRPVAVRVQLPGGARAMSIASGANHSCALTVDDRVVCWGRGSVAPSGDSSTVTTGHPWEVPGLRATMLAAGDGGTCALQMEGTIRCWNHEEAARQSHSEGRVARPGRLVTIPGQEDVLALAAGGARACALTRGGWIWCWTNAAQGAARTPRRVGRGPYVAVALQGNRTCAVSRGRDAECWSGAVPSRRASRRGPRVRASFDAPSTAVASDGREVTG